MVVPEDDLKCLMDNEFQLEMCGYYYGKLSWFDASYLLTQCEIGTFLVRDSEHSSYLYTLSVQTKKGPTSCRIEYLDGSFRLNSSNDISHKMPRFECVTHLIDFYVNLPKRMCGTAVWLDMDEGNRFDVPVWINQPLYRQVRNLQHMSRVNIVSRVRMNPCKPSTAENPGSALESTQKDDIERQARLDPCKPSTAEKPGSALESTLNEDIERLDPSKPSTIENPALALKNTLEKDSQCKNLPSIIKEYLSWYPYSQ